MSLENNTILNAYSIVIILIIYAHALRIFEKDSLQDKLYMWMLYTTVFMLCIDTLSRFDGNAFVFYPMINAFGNFTIFMMNLILPSLWIAYVHLRVFHDEKKTRKLIYPLSIINTMNVVILIFSQPYGWFYYIDSNNLYHRGPFFLAPVFVAIILILLAFSITLVNRRRLGKKTFLSLLFFAVPPCASIVLQIRFYGISLMLNSVVLSLLVIFMNTQNHSIYTDYLTGVSNRKKLDAYIKEKVNSCAEGKGFSAIMIDINNFKYINDTHGHDVGDNALETTAKLLKSCIQTNDFIARYGGDEFCIILDTSNKNDLKALVHTIKNCLEKYNKSGSNAYKLWVSIGYAVYDCHLRMSAEEFLKKVDILLYQDKKTYKNMSSQ